MVTAFAPGKLFIAGEYAVVTPGEPAVLIAVDRGITVTVEARESGGEVHSGVYEEPLRWQRDEQGAVRFDGNPAMDLVMHTLVLADRLARTRDRAPLAATVTITSELVHESGEKLGLGSSAAVTVALVAALNVHLQLGLSELQRFQLALIAVLMVSPRASGADIASSTLGGWTYYRSPDRDEVMRLVTEQGLAAAVDARWPGLILERLPAPTQLHLAVGWTRTPAATDALVAANAPDRLTQMAFLRQSRAAVETLAAALRGRDDDEILHQLAASQRALANFDGATGQQIETAMLRQLRVSAERAGAIAKVSGAGGGDCGVALSKDHVSISRMKEDWLANGIIPLAIAVTESGANVSE